MRDLKANKVNAEGSSAAFGFKASSRSIRPIHLAHNLFVNIVGQKWPNPALLEFVERPSKVGWKDLDENLQSLVRASHSPPAERYDRLRRHLRAILDNDNALYRDQRWTAPTCTSERFLMEAAGASEIGRFVYNIVEEAGGHIEEKLQSQLKGTNDAISAAFRPLTRQAGPKSAKVSEWSGPELDEPFENSHSVVHNLVQGFETLGLYVKGESGGRGPNFPRDLRRVLKFAGVSFYIYCVNRNTELEDEALDYNRLPLVMNYTGGRENPVAEASVESFLKGNSEVQLATRKGIAEVLDWKGGRSLTESEIHERIEEHSLFVSAGGSDADDERHEEFRAMFESAPHDDPFARLTEAMSEAIHHSHLFEAYTPEATVQTFAWRVGLVKPRGNRANERRFRPDPEMLEAIIQSLVSPGEQVTLSELCERMRKEYGFIVGGTTEDRAHLREWGIRLGSSEAREDPLNSTNLRGFTDELVSLGLAERFADGVTVVGLTRGVE